MKTLLLLRHAHTSPAQPGQPDFDRPLSQRGRHDAPRLGQWLRQHELVPDLIIASSARRAAETADDVAAAADYTGERSDTRSLYEAGTDAYFDVLRGLPDTHATVLLVAHNPGIEDMVAALTGQSEIMPVGALAHLTLPSDHWHALQADRAGRLVQVIRPRDLK